MTTASPETTRSGAEYVDLDRRHLIHPSLHGAINERRVIVRGHGSTLWDADGVDYLDATGGLWLVQIGHGREEISAVAAKQMSELAYFTCFWEFSNNRAVELAEKLVELAPGDLPRVFYTSGGSESNETAMKAARLYWFRKGRRSGAGSCRASTDTTARATEPARRPASTSITTASARASPRCFTSRRLTRTARSSSTGSP
jgi:putrescine aminotransferase